MEVGLGVFCSRLVPFSFSLSLILTYFILFVSTLLRGERAPVPMKLRHCGNEQEAMPSQWITIRFNQEIDDTILKAIYSRSTRRIPNTRL